MPPKHAGEPVARPIAKRRDTYHHGDLRQALLDATLRLIAEKGAEGFTLRAAARLAGVSDAAPYHHFADKEALLAVVAEEGFRTLHDRMRRAAEACEGGAADIAREMGVAYVLFAATHPSHFRVMVSRMVLRQTKYPALASAAAEAFTFVESKLTESLTEEQSRLPPEEVHFGSWALVHGLAFLAIDGHLGPIARDEERLRRLVRGVMAMFSGA